MGPFSGDYGIFFFWGGGFSNSMAVRAASVTLRIINLFQNGGPEYIICQDQQSCDFTSTDTDRINNFTF